MIIKRLNQYINNKGISLYAFENKLAVSRGSISKAIKENKNIGSNVLENILVKFNDINPEWLMTGVGDMLKSEPKKSHTENEEIVEVVKEPLIGYLSASGTHLIPLIPVDAMAGFSKGETQVDVSDITTGYLIPEFKENGVQYLIRVNGASMSPKYNSGDILGCKPITDISFFQWGKPYVLDTDQGPLVKRLFKHETDDDLLLCVSENAELYPPFTIHKNSIYRIALVVGVVGME